MITSDREVFDQCTSTIVRQVDDIKRMVDEFSSFARMPKPTIGREDIVDTVRHVLVMMRIAHPEIAFVDQLPLTPVEADFDRRLMSQSVTNIIKNAAEAIAAVPEEERGEGKIRVAVGREGDDVVIEISDNGKGFPTEGRHRLLEPYMTTREGGTGLGLAIVSKILEEHGGGIELRDNPARLDGTGAQVLDLALEARGLERAVGDEHEPVGLERLLDEVVGAGLDRRDGGLDVAVARDHHHRQVRMLLLDDVEHLQPVEPAALQPDVEENEVGPPRLDRGERLVGGAGGARAVALVLEDSRHELADIGFVVADLAVAGERRRAGA